MAYATVDDVQGRMPRDLWSAGPDEQPSQELVADWLDGHTAFLDGALSWKYVTPVTDATDLKVVRDLCAQLAAADVWEMRGGYDKDQPNAAASMRRNVYLRLAYDAKTGYAHLVLPGTTLADSGEADVLLPEGSFDDPDACGNDPRLFSIGMQF